MQLVALALSIAAGSALPSFPSISKGGLSNIPCADLPDSPSVIKALSDPEYYDQLSTRFQQSPLQLDDVFKSKSRTSDDTCGTASVCPAYEGKTETINGREYNLYCINAPWGTYFWLPTAKSLAECEANCHKNSYDCNGLTFYPSTGACALIYSPDSTPYIWDNGYQKIGAIPTNQPTAFGPGALCPLPASDNQVWNYGAYNEYPFKVSCLNSFQVSPSSKKQIGFVDVVDECAVLCAEDEGCYGFHWYQDSLSGGRADGKRRCEHVMEKVGEGHWTAMYKPNQYMAGLKIEGDWRCGEPAWDQDNGCRVEEE
ncbi:MAG: hypothetical protein Q9166_005532 [cf. Caloplaca sp. 2 TL-2023]